VNRQEGKKGAKEKFEGTEQGLGGGQALVDEMGSEETKRSRKTQKEKNSRDRLAARVEGKRNYLVFLNV